MASKKQVGIFLDSGAFSAQRQGIEIDIKDYIKFIKEHEEALDVYANLDVIGDAEATLKNQKIMEDAGLHPLPCFHIGEDFKTLRYYIERYDYIALGGLVPIRDENTLNAHLDKCFMQVCDTKDFLPRVKIHGFGVTSLSVLLKYPWYSVDSTSWVLTGRYGAVYVPKKRGNKYDYTKLPYKVTVSNLSPDNKEAGKAFSTFTKMEQMEIEEYFELKGYEIGHSIMRVEDRTTYKPNKEKGERWFGKEEADSARAVIESLGVFATIPGWTKNNLIEMVMSAGLSNDYKQRDELNITYFLDLEKNMPPWPQPFHKNGLSSFGLRGEL